MSVFGTQKFKVSEKVLKSIKFKRIKNVVKEIIQKEEWKQYKGQNLPEWLIENFYEKVFLFKNNKKNKYYVSLSQLPWLIQNIQTHKIIV